MRDGVRVNDCAVLDTVAGHDPNLIERGQGEHKSEASDAVDGNAPTELAGEGDGRGQLIERRQVVVADDDLGRADRDPERTQLGGAKARCTHDGQPLTDRSAASAVHQRAEISYVCIWCRIGDPGDPEGGEELTRPCQVGCWVDRRPTSAQHRIEPGEAPSRAARRVAFDTMGRKVVHPDAFEGERVHEPTHPAAMLDADRTIGDDAVDPPSVDVGHRLVEAGPPQPPVRGRSCAANRRREVVGASHEWWSGSKRPTGRCEGEQVEVVIVETGDQSRALSIDHDLCTGDVGGVRGNDRSDDAIRNHDIDDASFDLGVADDDHCDTTFASAGADPRQERWRGNAGATSASSITSDAVDSVVSANAAATRAIDMSTYH